MPEALFLLLLLFRFFYLFAGKDRGGKISRSIEVSRTIAVTKQT